MTKPKGLMLLALAATILSYFTASKSIPFVVFHGLNDKCSNSGVSTFTESLSTWSGSPGQCVEIGDGSRDSWLMSLSEQVDIACEKVKNMSELADGFNIVGLSQGTMIGRAIIEYCDGAPPVKNFVSLAGIHAGIASVPFCGSKVVCVLVDDLIRFAVYSSFVQDHLGPSGYIKLLNDYEGYIKGCKFLPKVNNEIKGERDCNYKERFSRLENLVLIMFENDTVLVPRETSHFGYYSDESLSSILPAEETALYTEDWIGLKALNEAGNVTFVNVSGGHLDISLADMRRYVLPYLIGDASISLPRQSSAESNDHVDPRDYNPLLLRIVS